MDWTVTGEPLPAVAYKFFSSENLNAIRDRGSVRIGTAESYRIADGWEDGRADTQELVSKWKPGACRVTNRHPMFRDITSRRTYPDSFEVEIIIGEGTRFVVAHNAYLLCLSQSLDDELCKRMLDRFGCDMVYEIPNVEAYFKCLMQADQRLAECRVKKVKYDAPDGFDAQYDRNVFRKRPAFSWQREIRAAWSGSEGMEPFTIEIPELAKLINVQRNPAAR